MKRNFSHSFLNVTSSLVIATLGSQASVAAQDEVAAVEEVIVTARKRDERLQDVPVSIAAITGAELEKNGVEDITDLYGSIPSLYFSSSALSPGRDFQFLTIRGIGANSQLEPSTGTFVDGVYMPSLGFDIGFLSLERIEVLRGPQGTLFGRNTQGGALNIVTAKPAKENGGKAAIELDEFNSIKAGVSIDLPVTEDKFYINVAGQVSTTSGYINNTTLDENADDWDKVAGRASFLFTPSESVEMILRLDGSSGKGHSAVPGVEAGCECYTVSSEFQEDQKATNWGGSFHLVADLDGSELTAITGYRKLKNIMPFDFDASNEFTNNRHDLETEQSIFSQELRLASTTDGDFSWLAGLYAYNESLTSDRQYSLFDLDTFFDDILNRQTVDTDRKGWAAFGQASYTIADFIDITGGLRYSKEKVENISDVEFSVAPIGFFGAFVGEGEDTYEDVSPMGSIAMRWSDDLMTYFTVSKGFKGGGFDKAPGSSLNVRAVGSETSVNYELGIKASTSNNKLTMDASIYRVNIKDQQLQTIVIVDDVPFSAIANAGKSHTQGFELSMKARPTEALTLTANIGHTDTEYDEYVDGYGTDKSGFKFPYVPAWTASVGAQHVSQLSNNKSLTISANYSFVDKYTVGADQPYDPLFNMESYSIFDASATLAIDRWQITLFADNLFNKYVATNRWNAFFFAGDSVHRDTVLPPRRIGLRVSTAL